MQEAVHPEPSPQRAMPPDADPPASTSPDSVLPSGAPETGEVLVRTDVVLTMEEVADVLRLSIGYVRKMALFDETFRTVKIGRRRLMRREALDAWLEQREVDTCGEPFEGW